jgi:molybdopterin-dependent oxidoreductase alpha subunit
MAADMQGRIEPRFFETFSLAQLQTLSPRELESAGRLTFPVIARPGDTHYQPIEWEDALQLVAEALRKTQPQRAFFYASGRSSNEAGFLLHLFARAFGTNHVNNCSFYCHQASGVGLKQSLGTSTATVVLDDLEHCDTLFLIGGNPASNHPRLMSLLVKLRARGGNVIVVNPLREIGLERFRVPSQLRSMLMGSDVASLYLQPAIGGDIALFAGIAKSLLESNAVDKDYVDQVTEEYGPFEEHIRGLDWEVIETFSGVARSSIEEAAKIYAKSDRTIFAWTMGITHHLHGVENVQWIVNLALMRGMVGRPGAGVLPIRGHSNVQGMGSIGVTPALKEAAIRGLESLGLQAPAFTGYDTMATLEASARGEMDWGLCLGGNLFGASPEASFTHDSLAHLNMITYLSTSLNTGHAHGLAQTTLILPVQARDEETQATTQESMFSFVRLSEGGKPRHIGPRSETDILADLAQRTCSQGAIAWPKLADHDEVRSLIARLVPDLEPIAEIGKSKREFHIAGRSLHAPVFATATGKASFAFHPIPELPSLEQGQFRMMTIRSEGQFNTVVYEEEDLYRGQSRRDVILMNPEDMNASSFTPGQTVDVTSDVGEMRGIICMPFDIAAGCVAMYYPESNVLVPRAVDARSKTPSFKSVAVRLTPSKQTTVSPIQLESDKAAIEASRRRMKAC